jgi:hypothetical protein
MRHLRILLFFFLPVLPLHAQESEDCKVLVPALQGAYQGGCKNGLAQGKGTASGTDAYTGSFKNGYPQGKGIYTWASGNTYKGEWNQGVMDGEGVFTGRLYGKDTIMTGIWNAGKYMGPKPVAPKVTTKYNVVSTSFKRTGEGSSLTVSFFQNGIINKIESLEFSSSSGSEVQSGNITHLWNIHFPFNCKINYVSWNSLRTQQYDCILEFEITQPGDWELRVGN